MKLKLSDFDVINHIEDRGIIVLPSIYTESFRQEIFVIIKDLLYSVHGKLYNPSGNVTTFDAKPDIYVKWGVVIMKNPSIWISNITMINKHSIKEYTHYLQIKQNSINRGIVHSQNFLL